MKSQLYTDASCMTAVSPAQWAWIGCFEESGAARVRHAGHQRWMQAHTERHDFRELMLVLEGGGCYGLGNRLYRLRPGVVMLFDKGEPHDLYYSPFQPRCRHLWLRLISPQKAIGNEVGYKPRRSVPAAAAAGTGTSSRRHVMIQGPYAECLTQGWDACSAGDTSSLAVARLKAVATAILLEALSRGALQEEGKEQMHHGRAVVEELGDYIASHLRSDLSLNALAHLSGYEPHYLERLLRRHMGEPLRRHVNRLRLARAMELLAAGMAVGAAGEALGFGSVSYFSRFFRQAAGLSPATWQARQARQKKIR
jgi:AraC-like DNA-binding protein